jgi:hypothetical protein
MKERFFQALICFCIACGLVTVVSGLHFYVIHAQPPHGTASEEVPRGAVDGVNFTYILTFQPAPWGSLHVFRNGLRQMRHLDYELGGPNHTQVIFVLIPQPGDILLADYTY